MQNTLKDLMKATFTGMMKMTIMVTQPVVLYQTEHMAMTQIYIIVAGKGLICCQGYTSVNIDNSNSFTA